MPRQRGEEARQAGATPQLHRRRAGLARWRLAALCARRPVLGTLARQYVAAPKGATLVLQQASSACACATIRTSGTRSVAQGARCGAVRYVPSGLPRRAAP